MAVARVFNPNTQQWEVVAQGAKGEPGGSSWEQVTGKPATFPPSVHTHEVSQVTGLQAALDGKAAASHSHTWGEVTGKPTTFPPSTHAHVSADVTDAVSNGSQSGAAGKLVAWDSGGHIDIQSPIRGTNPTTRTYVQNQVAAKLSTSEAETTTAISASKLARRTSTKQLQVDVDPAEANDLARKAYVDARPALFSGAGAPPAAIAGAVVGDWWLNTSTMELSKITGV